MVFYDGTFSNDREEQQLFVNKLKLFAMQFLRQTFQRRIGLNFVSYFSKTSNVIVQSFRRPGIFFLKWLKSNKLSNFGKHCAIVETASKECNCSISHPML